MFGKPGIAPVGRMQQSVIVGLPNVTTLLHCPESAVTVMFPGQVKTGMLLSSTVTFCVHVAVPVPLVAVHVTTVVPIGNTDGALLVTVTGLPLQSVAVALNRETIPELQVPGKELSVIAGGQK